MKELLEDCPVRVVVLDSRTAAVPLTDPRGEKRLDDGAAFEVALKWFESGVFPRRGKHDHEERADGSGRKARRGRVPSARP